MPVVRSPEELGVVRIVQSKAQLEVLPGVVAEVPHGQVQLLRLGRTRHRLLPATQRAPLRGNEPSIGTLVHAGTERTRKEDNPGSPEHWASICIRSKSPPPP